MTASYDIWCLLSFHRRVNWKFSRKPNFFGCRENSVENENRLGVHFAELAVATAQGFDQRHGLQTPINLDLNLALLNYRSRKFHASNSAVRQQHAQLLDVRLELPLGVTGSLKTYTALLFRQPAASNALTGFGAFSCYFATSCHDVSPQCLWLKGRTVYGCPRKRSILGGKMPCAVDRFLGFSENTPPRDGCGRVQDRFLTPKGQSCTGTQSLRYTDCSPTDPELSFPDPDRTPPKGVFFAFHGYSNRTYPQHPAARLP